jgi:hypothetical protein
MSSIEASVAGVPPPIVGVDFTSSPSRRKPITLAWGRLRAGALPDTGNGPGAATLVVEHIDACEGWPAFERFLASGHWVAAFDFPFGLPRDFLDSLGWPIQGDDAWASIVGRVASLTRAELVDRCRAFCDGRPVGSKFAHRATDATAGCSPSMRWVNPPVVLMLHAGAPRLLAAGVTLPALRDGDPRRIALEGYPGLLARDVLGRSSYKSDERRKDDAPRREARRRLVEALESGAHQMAIRVDFGDVREACIDEPMADRLDAVLCAVEAAWAWQRRDAGWGLPARDDRVEGWIVGA